MALAAVPHDAVTLKNGQTVNVAPLAQYFGAKPNFQGAIDLQPFDDQWHPKPARSVTSGEMTGIDYYELLALAQVNEFLNKPLDQGSRESEQFISRVEMLQAAEKVLTTVLRFHESAQQRGQRQADAQHCLRAERTPDPMANLP